MGIPNSLIAEFTRFAIQNYVRTNPRKHLERLVPIQIVLAAYFVAGIALIDVAKGRPKTETAARKGTVKNGLRSDGNLANCFR